MVSLATFSGLRGFPMPRSVLVFMFSLLFGSTVLARSSEVRDRPEPELPAPGAAKEAASDWGTAFPEASVSAHVPPGTRILVVAAGKEKAAEDAAAALVEVLRSMDRAGLVMTDELLRPLDGLGDEAILAKAEGPPVDLVSIVRVFPDSDGAPSAVITFYSTENSARTSAWSTSPNAGLRPSGSAPGQPTSQEGATALREELTDEEAAFQDPAVEAYEENFIGVNDFLLVNSHMGVVPHTTFYLGKYKRDLPLGELFTLVDRPDLRAEFERRSALKLGLMLGGLGTQFASVVGAVVGSAFQKRMDATWLIVGGVGFLAGGAAFVVGMFLPPLPVPLSEVRRLVDDYNRQLKGAPDGGGVGALLQDLRFGIAPVEGGALAGLSGRF